MLLPPTSHSSHTSGSTRFGRQRRRLRKLAVVCRLLGALCVVAAVLFFISSRMNEKKIARKQVIAGVIFLSSSPVLLVVGVGLDWWKHRFYGRGQRRHSSSSSANGDGQGHGNGAPRAAELPTR